MFKKPIMLVVVLCLALASLVPGTGSALTLSEITGTQAVSSYTPVTITSATNKTITITATPLSFASNQWMYQVSWNRAKNAKGSLYVSLKSNNGTKVATVATADQAGSTTFTALPSTAYRVEFYSQPNGKGSLLVRKYFTALAAEKASVIANQQNPITQTIPNGTALTSQQLLNLVKVDAGCQSPSHGCGYAGLLASYAAKVGGPIDMSKNTMVLQIAYRTTDGCYYWDRDGKWQLSADPKTCTDLPVLAGGVIPDPANPDFNWTAAHAMCGWKDRDKTSGIPFINNSICGGTTYMQRGFQCLEHQGDPNCTGYTATIQDYINLVKMDSGCQSVTDNCGYGDRLAAVSQKVGAGINVSAKQTSVVQIFYRTADGCYYADRSGTWKMPLAASQCTQLPLIAGSIPDPNNPDFNWTAAHAACAWLDQDHLTKQPFMNASICGGTVYTQQGYNCVEHQNDPSCTGYTPTIQDYINLVQRDSGCQSVTDNCGYGDRLAAVSQKVGAGINVNAKQTSVLQIFYRTNDGCYYWDRSGQWKLPVKSCGELPLLVNGSLPDPANPDFNWNASRATCGWLDQDHLTKQPFMNNSVCGGTVYMQKGFNCVEHSTDPTCSGYAKTVQDYINLVQWDSGCQSVTDNCGYGDRLAAVSQKVGAGLNVTAKQTSVLQIFYRTADGCYYADRSGTWKMPLATSQCTQLPLVTGNLPDPNNPDFNWNGAHASCGWLDQDHLTKQPFMNNSVCGGTVYMQNGWCSTHPSDSSCQTPYPVRGIMDGKPAYPWTTPSQTSSGYMTIDQFCSYYSNLATFPYTYKYNECVAYYTSIQQNASFDTSSQSGAQATTGSGVGAPCRVWTQCAAGLWCYDVTPDHNGYCR